MNVVQQAGKRIEGVSDDVEEEVKVVVLQGNNECKLTPEIWVLVLKFSVFSDITRTARVSKDTAYQSDVCRQVGQ